MEIRAKNYSDFHFFCYQFFNYDFIIYTNTHMTASHTVIDDVVN